MNKRWKFLAMALVAAAALVGLGARVRVQFVQAAAGQVQTTASPTPDRPIPDGLESIRAASFRSVSQSTAAKVAGMERSGKFFVSFGPAPEFFLTVTYPNGDAHAILQEAVMNVLPVPGTELIAFTAVGENRAPYPIYLISVDGSGLRRIGETQTPWRLQTTERGMVAFRQGSELVVYDVTNETSTSLPGITLQGEYGYGDTVWSVSPDGTKVATRDNNTLLITDTTSGLSRRFEGSLVRHHQAIGSWSPDGALFAFGTEASSRAEHPVVWVISVEDEPRRLFELEHNGGRLMDFGWLNRQHLIVNYIPVGPLGAVIPSTEYYVVTINGGGKLLFTNGMNLATSPDSKTIYVHRQTKIGSVEDLEVVQVDLVQ